jgi:4-hydroxybutyrate CoA-transferase
MMTNSTDAVRVIESNSSIFIHTAAATPMRLINALSQRHQELRNVSVYSLHTEGDAPYSNIEFRDSFTPKPMFVGPNIRENIQSGRGSYIPVFLSEAPNLFRTGVIRIDVALITVSPPDIHGYCSLGTSVDISLAAVETARIVIAQINEQMPRTHGDGFIHISRIHAAVGCDDALPEIRPEPLNEKSMAIGKHVAELIDDGATLQLGIGSIPNAVLTFLNNHKNLGIHSEMFSDGILPLVDSGVINGSKKNKHRGMIVGSFAVGTKALYNFMHDNPILKMLDFSYVNSVEVIRKNPKVSAINSAIEIDLSGQICADSMGTKIYSGIGGQMDFIRGAALSEGGKPIIALPSVTRSGESRIVPVLRSGAGVVTTRGHVHYVVTEFGSVNLHGKTIQERARLLTSIAHPAHREWLEKSFREMY